MIAIRMESLAKLFTTLQNIETLSATTFLVAESSQREGFESDGIVLCMESLKLKFGPSSNFTRAMCTRCLAHTCVSGSDTLMRKAYLACNTTGRLDAEQLATTAHSIVMRIQ
eukprot:1251530-Amphidinium_carterae.1